MASLFVGTPAKPADQDVLPVLARHAPEDALESDVKAEEKKKKRKKTITRDIFGDWNMGGENDKPSSSKVLVDRAELEWIRGKIDAILGR